MAKGPSAQPVQILGSLANAEFAYLEYTVASGVVTAVKAPKGWSVTDFSTGVSALAFPKHYSVFYPFEGQEDTDNASSTSRHRIVTKTVDVAAGTAVLRCEDGNDGTTENPVDGTFRLLYLVAG